MPQYLIISDLIDGSHHWSGVWYRTDADAMAAGRKTAKEDAVCSVKLLRMKDGKYTRIATFNALPRNKRIGKRKAIPVVSDRKSIFDIQKAGQPAKVARPPFFGK